MRPYGFEVGEVWGIPLALPKNSAAWPNVSHAYTHVIDHVRVMLKPEEFEKYPEAWDVAIGRIERAKELGVPILLCIDGFNTWWGRDTGDTSVYHDYVYHPNQDWWKLVRDFLRLVEPKWLQVWNEPYTRSPFRTKSYAEMVYEFVRGARAASFTGEIIAAQSKEGLGDLHDAWEWHVGYDDRNPDALIAPWDHGCFEGKHNDPRVLHKLHSVAELLESLNSNAWTTRNVPRGWRWLVMHDEISPLGKDVHINSSLGYDMVKAALGFFRQHKVPMTFLTMDGYSDDWGADGDQGWGMNTGLINGDGQLSKGCKALYDFKGVSMPDEPNGGNGNGGGGGGSNEPGFDESVSYVKRVHYLFGKGQSIKEVQDDRQARRRYNRWMRKIRD